MEIRTVPSASRPPAGTIEREQVAPPAQAATPAAPHVGAAATPETSAEAGAGLKQAVERINQALPPSNQGIEFAIDEDSERVIVKVVDRETREVLRQMPTQEALDIAKALDRTQGLLIKLEA